MDQTQPANNTMQVLPNGIILLTQTGFQTKDSISLFQAKIDDLTAKMHTEKQKVLILVDVSGVTGQEPEVLPMARDRLKGSYDALAIYGTSTPIRMIINWLLHAIGNDARVKSFDKYDDAMGWLLAHQA